jgi:hypothetical protein
MIRLIIIAPISSGTNAIKKKLLLLKIDGKVNIVIKRPNI